MNDTEKKIAETICEVKMSAEMEKKLAIVVQSIKTPKNSSDRPSLATRFSEWLEWIDPFDRYCFIKSYDEYVNLSYSEKTVWFFLYKEHSISGRFWTLTGITNSDDELIENYKKYRWPIQYFLRKNFDIRFWRHTLKNIWYTKVSCVFNPRQKWLTKKIPNTWADKVSLIQELNFEMVLNFVDYEKCFECINYDSDKYHKKFSKELKECYNYISVERPILVEQYESSFPDLDQCSGDYKKDYGETNRLEKLLNDTDTKYLTWIVKNRGFFWV